MHNGLEILRDERLRAEAARDVVAEIRRHAEEASADLAPVVRYLADHLFDADLSEAGLPRQHTGDPRSFRKSFRSLTGRSPTAYVSECRVRVGEGMALATDLAVKAIAMLLGFRTTREFRRRYLELRGESLAVRRATVAPGLRRAPEPEPGERMILWRQVVVGAWLAHDSRFFAVDVLFELALDLLVSLAVEDPEIAVLFSGSVAPAEMGGYLFHETFKAVRVREVAFAEPWREQHSRVASPVPLDSLALAELLGLASETEASARKALHLARLSVRSLVGCRREYPAAALSEYRVRVYMRVLRAAVDAGDTPEAEEALALGEVALRRAAEPATKVLGALIVEGRAVLTLHQGALAEAGRLAGEAATLYVRAGEAAEAARCLALKVRTGRAAAAELQPQLEAGLGAAEASGQGGVAAALSAELGAIYILGKQYGQARKLLDRLEDLDNDLRGP